MGPLEKAQGATWRLFRQLLKLQQPANVQVQFGGGLRTLLDLEAALALGVTRTILGTSAAQKPEIIGQAVTRFGPQAVGVGIDAQDGIVKIQGWQELSGLTALELG